ncbi:hypothetical protein [Brenneria tiliae]|uniref:hypothetical protein n=1 Tax=Brenneria tiliae TaxID=2914984 RepID=UPI002014F336|nr:hypothetical protein [Brenneria tiliae]MCL2898684.1 hypothetical protein [Brenneria tiliae]MCL2902773.1 hypothetical protein [Brenneria tiliae]
MAVERNGKRLNKVFSNTEEGYRQLAVWLDKKGLAQAECHLCMEATSTYYEALALWLHEHVTVRRTSRRSGYRRHRR